MPLNAKQLSLHWREFAAAKRAALAAGHPEPDRKECYIKAGVVVMVAGHAMAKSLTKFNNGDLDKVLAVFRSISQPANFDAQVNATEQPRIRLEYSIRELASQITERPVHIADAYWEAVFRDMFWSGGLNPDNPGQSPDLSLLSVQQLEWLRNRLQEIYEGRRSKHKPRAPLPESESRLPSLEPEPFQSQEVLKVFDDDVPF